MTSGRAPKASTGIPEALIDVAGGVFFGDDNTVQATTPGAPALGGTLRGIRQGFYWVEV